MNRTLIRLREVTAELAMLHRELAQVRIAEAQAKTEVWRNTPSDASVTMTRESARVNAATFTVDVIRLLGDIEMYREEKDFLIECLRAGVDLGDEPDESSVDGH